MKKFNIQNEISHSPILSSFLKCKFSALYKCVFLPCRGCVFCIVFFFVSRSSLDQGRYLIVTPILLWSWLFPLDVDGVRSSGTFQ